jgi:S-adenosyl-L-methionine hydrolase (adenosine-forming)
MRIITLITDFGTADGYVGAMKGVILGRCPGAVVVDVAHDLPRHDVIAGAYALLQAAPHFPAGTIHLAVVDPGVGGTRQAVVVDGGDQLYVGPDNGIFELVCPEPRAAYRIEADAFRAPQPSATFHGRDLFATAAGSLAAGASADQAGPRCELRGRLDLGQPPGDGGRLWARVIHVDAFGNLITDLRAGAIPPRARVRAAGRCIERLSTTFTDVAPGALVAYVGSAGTLEVAVREGDAAQVLDLRRGACLEVTGPA